LTFIEIIVAKTTESKFELIPVDYEKIGRISKPTQKAAKVLAKYIAWKNLSAALRYNLDLQADFQKICAEYF
jgi:hypothetical protein